MMLASQSQLIASTLARAKVAARAEKNREICTGTDRLYNWARKHGVKTVQQG